MRLAPPRSLREQHVARVLDRARDGALVLRAEPGVLAGQYLARVGDKADPGLRVRERDLRRRWRLLLLFGGGHVVGGGWIVRAGGRLSTPRWRAPGGGWPSDGAEVALVQREEGPAEALRAHPLYLQGDRVVVRDKAQELDPGDAEAARALERDHRRVGRAVLHEADLAEEL